MCSDVSSLVDMVTSRRKTRNTELFKNKAEKGSNRISDFPDPLIYNWIFCIIVTFVSELFLWLFLMWCKIKLPFIWPETNFHLDTMSLFVRFRNHRSTVLTNQRVQPVFLETLLSNFHTTCEIFGWCPVWFCPHISVKSCTCLGSYSLYG